MARKVKRSRTECEPARGPSDDDMPVHDTTPPRRSSEVQRCSSKKNKNKGKMMQILVKLMDDTSETRKILVKLMDDTSETRKLVESHIESNKSQTIMFGKFLEKLTASLEKPSESHNDPRKQLELHTYVPRAQLSQGQPPRYKLVFKSDMDETIEKGKSIKMHVALVDSNSGQTVKNGPLASATVELVVIDAKFNQNDNQYNWSMEDFRSNIKKARQGNSATVNVDQSGESIVSNGRFNLEHGGKCHRDFSIFSNSGNKKVRLGVMVVSPNQERVLEGLSNPFFVRGHDRPNRTRPGNGNQEQNGPMFMQNPLHANSTQADGNGWAITSTLEGQHQTPIQRTTPVLLTEPATCQQHRQVAHLSMANDASDNQIGVRDGCPEQNGPMPNMHNQLQQNSTQGLDIPYTQPSTSQVQQDSRPQNQDDWLNGLIESMNCGTGTPFYSNITYPVRLILDTPSVVPSKHYLNLPDQFMLPHSWQPKFYNCGLPTVRLLKEYFGSLATTMQKEVMQTRSRDVLIEPLEPDGSDEGWPLKRNLQNKYQLRFVNNACKKYYTWDQLKADEGDLLKVALFDENNTKIASGPLSSASIEVVALHGDFNGNDQDYWTSEEFSHSVLCPPPGEETLSVLGGNRTLVLAGGEACLDDVFFQRTSFCARNAKFKIGVRLLESAQEERVQEGISEPFRVIDRCVEEELPGIDGDATHKAPPPGFRFCPTDEMLINEYLFNHGVIKPFPVQVIAEVDIYKFDPWDLPARAVFGEDEWYFWSQPATSGILERYRAAGSGYWNWKATDQKETTIPLLSAGDDKMVGFKKTLTFYTGHAPKGIETSWIMDEYRLSITSSGLDERVLCKIYTKTKLAVQSTYEQVPRLGQQLPEGPEPEFLPCNDLPPGFRFHPRDDELVVHYLRSKVANTSCRMAPTVIAEVDIYRCDPWDLPGRAIFCESEWYFFSRRDRKYATGTRTNRATQSGYWMATGKDKVITTRSAAGDHQSHHQIILGLRKTLFFYKGRAPRGQRTDWVMHEYRLDNNLLSPKESAALSTFSTSGEWLLYKLFKKTDEPDQMTTPFVDDCHLQQLPVNKSANMDGSQQGAAGASNIK